MINNFQQIITLLQFDSEDEFYFLQLLARKKDTGVGCTSNSRVIKNYYINNVEYLLNKEEEITKLCNIFKARAYLRLNRRSYEQCAFKTLEKLVGQIGNKDYKSVVNYYQKVCGVYTVEKNKKWIVDLDDGWQNAKKSIDCLWKFINSLAPYDKKYKVYTSIPSKNGVHLITTPFNLAKFKERFPGIDVHKDNPTNLYVP